MKTVVKIVPKKYNMKYLNDYRQEHTYTFTPTSVFLKVLNEIEYLQSKVVSMSSKLYPLGIEFVEKDVIELMFKYKWRERKIFHREIIKLLMREDIAKAYYIEMKDV